MPNSAKFTPGPWRTSGIANKRVGILVWRGTLPDNNDYARICCNVRNPHDANLIAASPDLYEACKEMEARLTAMFDLYVRATYHVGSIADDDLNLYLASVRAAIQKAEATDAD